MNNIGSSFLLLAVALLLLWLAVTDKLSNLLDAWDVATGKLHAEGGVSNTANVALATPSGSPATVAITLPALPRIGTTASVGV